MRQNTQPEKQSLTPMQKQAVLVCIVCALAALLTIGITLVLIHRGKEPAASSEQPGTEQPADDANIADHYQINEQSSALLPETADAGDAYQSETLFIGDSNTVRLYANGLISLQQFCAKEGIGTSAALNEGIVTFKKDSSRYTIAEAVAKMKPRRVVIMLGTNDTGMAVEDFISNYKQLVQAIQTSYPYTDIIVNTVPPVPENHSNYPNMDQARIDDFNMALLSMCEQLGVSRTPFREAELELAQRRLIEIRPKIGTYVSLIDAELVEEVRHLRAVLEAEIARMACEKLTPADIDQLWENVALWRMYIERAQEEKIFELDKGFHRLLYVQCGCPYWYDLVENLAPHFDRTTILSFRCRPAKTIYEDHVSLLKAIEQKDAAAAHRIAGQHMQRYTENLSAIREAFPHYFKA